MFIWKRLQAALKGAAAKFLKKTRRILRQLPGLAAQYPRPFPEAYFL